MQKATPFIVTLILDEGSFGFFNDRRKMYFPAVLNLLSAHLTLFHQLPSAEPTIEKDLQRWSEQTSILYLQVAEVKSIGKGVVYKIESPELLQLHKAMQQKWKAWLTPQDAQKLWPHVTVQNKVSPAVAKETLQLLQSSFTPFTAQGIGFGLWYYEGGPWRLAKEFRFKR